MTRHTVRHLVTTGIVGLALLSLVPLSAQARGRGGKGPSPEQAVERLTGALDLTAEQQGPVKAILEESFAKRGEVREAHRSEMETLREETEGKLAAVLSPEQLAKLRQLRDARHGRRGEGDCRPDCGQRPDCRRGE